MSNLKLDEKRRWYVTDSSNVGAVRYFKGEGIGHIKNFGWLDVIFKHVGECQKQELHIFGGWDIHCSKCRPKIYYRYSGVLIEAFVDMLFDETSIGHYFSTEIKAQSDAPEKRDLIWP